MDRVADFEFFGGVLRKLLILLQLHFPQRLRAEIPIPLEPLEPLETAPPVVATTPRWNTAL
jgi:hypothetical protein